MSNSQYLYHDKKSDKLSLTKKTPPFDRVLYFNFESHYFLMNFIDFTKPLSL